MNTRHVTWRWSASFEGLGFIVLLFLIASGFGCRTYAPVTSQEGMQVIKRLVVACNARDQERLSRLEQDLKAFESAGKITAGERKTFESIVEMARKGDWAQAEKAALKLADDQVGNSVPATESR